MWAYSSNKVSHLILMIFAIIVIVIVVDVVIIIVMIEDYGIEVLAKTLGL